MCVSLVHLFCNYLIHPRFPAKDLIPHLCHFLFRSSNFRFSLVGHKLMKWLKSSGKNHVYLYFDPKTTVKWLQYHQNIISIIESCSKIGELSQVHAQIIRAGLTQDICLVSRIITFLTSPATHFNMDYARRTFDEIHNPNIFTWNSMIRGYTQNNEVNDALLLFKSMLERGFCPDNYTYPIVTKACSYLQAFEIGKLIHGHILKSGYERDMFVMSGVVSFYAGCEKVEIARKVFDEMRERDVVTWTAMISAYSHLNKLEECFLLFDKMRRNGIEPSKVTFVALLSACANREAIDKGQWLHSYIVTNKIEFDMVMANSLINMYAKCGSMPAAVEVFNSIPIKNNVVSWNVLMGGFLQNGQPMEALKMFEEMESSGMTPNEITIVIGLSACARLGCLEKGKLLHKCIEELKITYDVVTGNAIINMYSKCGDLEGARRVFYQMPSRDIFSWTALITGYVQSGDYRSGLALFQEMQLLGIKPNEVTLVSLLSACTQLGALDQGRWIHTYIKEHDITQDLCLQNALVDMYAKCGCIEIALQIFHCISCKDTFSWNVIIGGLAMHGHGKEAIALFTQMQRSANFTPDDVTFTAVLSACSHSGVVDEGFKIFNSMSKTYGITPGIEHYGCMVDLLGRAGLLEEAKEFVDKMPMEPNSIIWGSLLSACSIHHKLDLAEKIAQHILPLDLIDEGLLVLISNSFAEKCKWNDVRKIRSLMGSKGIEKSPGCSLIEIDGYVHEFHVRDARQHESSQIYLTLEGLMLQSKDASCESIRRLY